MTVIVLKDEQSYAKFLGEAPGKEVGGHYDVDANRLVIFDFHARQEGLRGNPERVNLFTLVHETGHQLTFNTGMLDRRGNLPLAILEGLATYVEMWRPGVKNGIGGENRPRLKALRQSEDWISLADLLADDKAFQPETEQLAYAESWLLVHYLLRSSTRQPRFRDYLAQCSNAQEARRSRPAWPRSLSVRSNGWITRSKATAGIFPPVSRQTHRTVSGLSPAPG